MRRSARCVASSAPSLASTANQSLSDAVDAEADADDPIAPTDPVEMIDELIGEAADVDVASHGDGFEYSRAGRVFAARSGSGLVEVRLGNEIAEAAQRTPDTKSSTRGSA